jgi:hypothetical protein
VTVVYSIISVLLFVSVSAADKTAVEILLTLILELKTEMRDVRSQISNMQELLRDMHSMSTLNVAAEDSLSIDLPIRTKQQLDELEAKLEEDRTLKEKLVSNCINDCLIALVLQMLCPDTISLW